MIVNPVPHDPSPIHCADSSAIAILPDVNSDGLFADVENCFQKRERRVKGRDYILTEQKNICLRRQDRNQLYPSINLALAKINTALKP